MDNPALMTGLVGVCASLLGVIAFFLKNLHNQFQGIAQLSVQLAQKIEDMNKQVERHDTQIDGIRSIREDVSALRATVEWFKAHPPKRQK